MSNGVYEHINARIEAGEIKSDEAILLTLQMVNELNKNVKTVEQGTLLWLLKNRTLQTVGTIVTIDIALRIITEHLPELVKLLLGSTI